ncbi:MAG: competence/damage-inducible protein A [Endomicrobiales bacterium]|nr:competence/damage-inducible protein A [Endomicrobiales bacterium]
MKVELICIGTELLTGKTNANISYIGDKLSTIGLDLCLAATVGDKTENIKKAFQQAIERSNIIISTGGLGPTFDDLTREAVSKVLNKPLVLNREVLSTIAQHFVKRNIEMPKNNERQAYIIEGARFILNEAGTAPGQIIEFTKNKKKTVIILLPGPPREVQPMFEKIVFPYLKKYETGFKRSVVLHICGLPESKVDEKILPIVEAERKLEAENVTFSILAHQMIIDIKVDVSGKDEMLVDEILGNIKHELYDVLKENIYGEDRKTLEIVVGELLTKNRKTFSVAESCTGGIIAHRLTNIPGSSLYFKQGLVVYSNESKVKVLGINEETLQQYGAVSAQTALEMAESMRNIANTDYAISVTGIAGPSGGTQDKPVGLVYIGLCGPNIKEAYKFHLYGARVEVRQRAANQALDLLRRQLLRDARIVKK